MLNSIVFRAFQGIGGSGLFSLVFCVFPEITPAKYYGAAAAMISSTFTFASLLGPVVGGAIASDTVRNHHLIAHLVSRTELTKAF